MKRKWTRAEINEAMLKAQKEAEGTYTFEYVRSIRPRQNTSATCSADDLEYDRGHEMPIDDLIAKLNEAKEKGAQSVMFSSSYHCEEIELSFDGARPETDHEWSDRINSDRQRFITSEMNKVKNAMDQHNAKVDQYLALKKDLED